MNGNIISCFYCVLSIAVAFYCFGGVQVATRQFFPLFDLAIYTWKRKHCSHSNKFLILAFSRVYTVLSLIPDSVSVLVLFSLSFSFSTFHSIPQTLKNGRNTCKYIRKSHCRPAKGKFTVIQQVSLF